MASRPDNRTRDEILAALPESAWTVAEVTDDYIRSWTQVDIGGQIATVWRTQYLADETLQKANTHAFNESAGKRWGDGRVVARLPLNVLFDPKRQIAEKLREGDRDHMNWWLNSDDARPFRAFKGRV